MNEQSLPILDNVYGYILCGNKINLVKEIIIRVFNLNDDSISFKQGVLTINTPEIEMVIKRKDSKKWSVNAAISGDESNVIKILESISLQLSWNGIESVYELYDDEFNCIANI